MCLTLESSQNFVASPLSTTMAFGVYTSPERPQGRREQKTGTEGWQSGTRFGERIV